MPKFSFIILRVALRDSDLSLVLSESTKNKGLKMATAHDNECYFKYETGISVGFTYVDNTENYRITKGQPFNGVKVTKDSSKSECIIDIDAGRKKKDDPAAKWYRNSVGGNENHMIHTQGGEHSPSELNFAIKGTLKINDDSYEVCLGQGHNKHNNWHLASDSLSSDANGKNGDFENKYRIEQDGTYSFKITKR